MSPKDEKFQQNLPAIIKTEAGEDMRTLSDKRHAGLNGKRRKLQ